MDDGDDPVVTAEARRAYAYLGAVTERPTAELWDLVDEVGPIEACDRIRLARVPDALAEQSASRRDRVDGAALMDAAGEVGAHLVVPGDPGWPAHALAPLDRPRGRRRGGHLLLQPGDRLQLAVVEEDAPAAVALLDVHAHPVISAHLRMALGTLHHCYLLLRPVTAILAAARSPVG